jgi:hypothetical protein
MNCLQLICLKAISIDGKWFEKIGWTQRQRMQSDLRPILLLYGIHPSITVFTLFCVLNQLILYELLFSFLRRTHAKDENLKS